MGVVDQPEPSSRLHPETSAVHVSAVPAPGRPSAVPLHQTSTFAFDDLHVFADAWSRPDGAFTYSRFGNPTAKALENAIAGLEGGAAAMATASGMGAISTVLLSILSTGDHVLAQRGLYGGTFALLSDLARRWGIEVTFVDVERPDEVRAAVRANTRMLYLETIANPMGAVCDLPALATMARHLGLYTVVDNTFASPVLCQPLRHGADVVVHSTTKYIAGHADVVGGVVVTATGELHETLWTRGTELGASVDPFAAWLTIRGLQTLPVRMHRHCANAGVIAARLLDHPKVGAVHWAGLAGHPSHTRASRLLSGYGGVFAFDLIGGMPSAVSFTGRIRLADLAPSLGGVGTTVLHPASISHNRVDPAELRAAGISDGTLRIAVGLEHPEDLWTDFEQALS